MEIVKNRNGKTYLHIWRANCAYECIMNIHEHQDWNNIRFSVKPLPKEKNISSANILNGIPFPPQSFDFIYVQHIVEHLTLEELSIFLKQLKHLLKPGGIVRISTPDLEEKVEEYLLQYNSSQNDDSPKAFNQLWWAQLDLYDQAVRNISGGEMLEYINSGKASAEQLKRTSGDVFLPLLTGKPYLAPLGRPSVLHRAVNKLRSFVSGNHPQKTREAHLWLFDEVFLTINLKKAEFSSIKRKHFNESDIPLWEVYQFDKSLKGDYPIEPSLYIEAIG
jgi:predicted SAM-dependent methyltransferase